MACCIRCEEHISKVGHRLDGEPLCEYCWSDFAATNAGTIEYRQSIYRSVTVESNKHIYLF